VRKTKAAKSLTALAVAALVASAVIYLLPGGKREGSVHANSGVTTERTAAEVGARVLPTDPALKIEPK
jgi:hypothetical protein